MDKIMFANFIYLDLKYLGVKSNYIKIRQEHKVVDFEICVACDNNKM